MVMYLIKDHSKTEFKPLLSEKLLSKDKEFNICIRKVSVFFLNFSCLERKVKVRK